MAGGRPTTYSKEMLDTAKAYVEDSTVYGHVVPSAAGLCVILHVARSTIYKWGEEHPEFSDILGELQAKQESELLQNGLTSIFNPVITKLMLGKHGYSDKQEITGKDGAPIFNDEQKEKADKAVAGYLAGHPKSGE